MDFKCWCLVYVISTFVNGYENDNCHGVKSFFQSLFIRCKYIKNDLILNCTDEKLVTLQSSSLPERNQIHELILKRCCMKTIDTDTFDKMTSLLLLDVSFNSLKILNYRLFEQTKSLSDLNLRYNDIDSIDYRLFNSNVKLQHLDLSHNNLNNLDHRLFEQQKELISLNLEYNKLHTLHDRRIFTSQGKLKELLMQSNTITTIDVNVLTPLNSITMLGLAGNPFVCHCHIQLTVDWCLNRSLDTNAICDYPPELKGKPWTNLNKFPECNQSSLMNSSVAMPAKEIVNEENLASHSIIKGLIIALVCVVLILVIVCILLCICCWRNFKGNHSRTNKIVKQSSLELNGSQYYESFYNTQDNNVAGVPSNCPFPPKVSAKEIVYDYVDPSTLHKNGNIPTTDIQESGLCDRKLKKDSTDFLPAEKIVQNEFYS